MNEKKELLKMITDFVNFEITYKDYSPQVKSIYLNSLLTSNGIQLNDFLDKETHYEDYGYQRSTVINEMFTFLEEETFEKYIDIFMNDKKQMNIKNTQLNSLCLLPLLSHLIFRNVLMTDFFDKESPFYLLNKINLDQKNTFLSKEFLNSKEGEVFKQDLIKESESLDFDIAKMKEMSLADLVLKMNNLFYYYFLSKNNIISEEKPTDKNIVDNYFKIINKDRNNYIYNKEIPESFSVIIENNPEIFEYYAHKFNIDIELIEYLMNKNKEYSKEINAENFISIMKNILNGLSTVEKAENIAINDNWFLALNKIKNINLEQSEEINKIFTSKKTKKIFNSNPKYDKGCLQVKLLLEQKILKNNCSNITRKNKKRL